jgi:succinate dehydrogenase / fumarate reductase membrane anchor subunit
MQYLTDRKRAVGLGSAKSGTEHFYNMQVTAVALAILVPLFLIFVAPAIGAPLDLVLRQLGHPVRAVITGLTLVVGLIHFKNGARVMIEDYAHGATRKALIFAAAAIAYVLIAAGLFALVRISLLSFAV